MPKVVNRHHTKWQKLSDGEKNLALNFQSIATLGHKEWFLLPIQPNAPTNGFSAAPKTIYYDLEPHDCKSIENLIIRVKLTASGGDVQTTGAAHLFSEIECRSNKGSGKRLFRTYPEMIIAWNMLTMNDECQQEWARLQNHALVDIKSKNQKKYWYNESNYIRDGESRYVYFQLPFNFIQFHALHLDHVKNPIRFIFETSSDIVINGSVNNLSLDGIDFIVCGHNETDFDAHDRLGMQRKANHSYNFLTADRLIINDKTYNASTKSEIFLDTFTAKSPFLMICIKGSTTPSASDGTLFDYYDIGKNGTMTIENTSGRDMISQGNPITQEQMYLNLNDQLGRKPYTGLHFLCFTEDIKKAIAGNIAGYYQFAGQRDKLAITFDAAPTAEVQSVDLGSTAVSGSYRYAFENMALSDQDADFDDNTSTLLNVINAIPALKDKGMSATAVSANINTSATHNVTFSTRSGRVCDELGKITLLGAPVKVNSTSVTTHGTEGWTSGSGYEISIFCWKYCKLIVTKDGDLDVEEL